MVLPLVRLRPVWQRNRLRAINNNTAAASIGFDPIPGPDEVDAAWLTEVFRRAGICEATEAVTAVAPTRIGTGQVGDNIRFELTWSPTSRKVLPRSVVGKFPSPSEVSRQAGIATRTYIREVGFYRDLQSWVSIRTPAIVHIGWEPATHNFALIMEDLATARPGDQLAGCTIEQAAHVIDQAVGLHAATWGRTNELALDWLDPPTPERATNLAALAQHLFDGFEARFTGRLSHEVLDLGRHFVARCEAWIGEVSTWADELNAWCVNHGDFRVDNILFGIDDGTLPDGDAPPPVTVVDWQTVTIGTGPSDVAYFLGSALEPNVRAEHEPALVKRYARGLQAAGINVDDEVVWEGYILGSPSGYLMAIIASQLVEQTARGDEMFAMMAERHAAQMLDLAALDQS